MELEDHLDAPGVALRFVRDLPEATGPFERTLLRSILMGFGLRLINLSHSDLSTCGCECGLQWARTLACLPLGDPAAAFDAWLTSLRIATRKAHPRVVEERAAWIIRRSFRQNVSPANLAHECGCSVTLLRIKFSGRYGMSFRQYLHLVRVVSACIELRNGRPKIEALARECGYCSKKDFYRVFRIATGCLPHVFRQLPANEADCCLAALQIRLVGGPRASRNSMNLAHARAVLARA